MENRKALIAMSGGVDSSVAALLMKEKGYDCVGCTMKLYRNEDAGIENEHTCCSLAYFHMSLVERRFGGHSQKAAHSPRLNQRVLPQLRKLLLCQILESAMRIAAYLAKRILLNAFIDG